jgi:hypothetical protein
LEKINVPHDWVVELPFVKSEQVEMDSHGYKPVGGAYPETSIGWYRKHFSVDKKDDGNVSNFNLTEFTEMRKFGSTDFM